MEKTPRASSGQEKWHVTAHFFLADIFCTHSYVCLSMNQDYQTQKKQGMIEIAARVSTQEQPALVYPFNWSA